MLVKVEIEQLSEAVGAVQFTTASQDAFAATLIVEGQPLTTGFVLSVTVTLKVQVDVFPFPSVAVYVTSVVPNGKLLPGVWEPVNVETEQLSTAVGSVQVPMA